jgi:hypothetical protein
MAAEGSTEVPKGFALGLSGHHDPQVNQVAMAAAGVTLPEPAPVTLGPVDREGCGAVIVLGALAGQLM